jgi:hypothetical protein
MPKAGTIEKRTRRAGDGHISGVRLALAIAWSFAGEIWPICQISGSRMKADLYWVLIG